MATRGDSGQLFALLREASRDGARVGQTFALVSVLSIVGGVGLVVLTETFQFDAGTLRTYRTFAGGLVGYGLPALLYGMTIAANESGNGRTADVSVVGVLLSVLAVVAFLLTYPERWAGAGAAGYVVPTLAVYGLGVLFCSAAAGGAILAGRDETGGTEGNRLGQTIVLFSALSIVGGVGLVVLTETFQFDAGTLRTYRTFAGGLVGYGLPALLYGFVITDGERKTRTADVSVVGVLLSVLAVVAFLLTYPERWAGAGAAGYVVPTLAVYGLGVLFCSAAAGGAILAGCDAADESDDRSSPTHPDTDDETGFIWGSPPES